MVTLYVILGIALIAATAWVFTNPDTRHELGEATERTANTVKALPDKVSDQFKDKREGALKAWLAGKSVAEREAYVQQASSSIDNFLKWADEMPAETARDLNKHVKELIEKMGLDLDWITNQKLANYPVLKQELEEAVLLTAESYWKAQELRHDIEAFKAFQSWQAKPHARSQRDFSQKLYSRLVANNLVSSPPPNLFLESEKKRQNYIVESIRLAALKDRVLFNDLVKQVVLGDDKLVSPEVDAELKAERKAAEIKNNNTSTAEGDPATA